MAISEVAQFRQRIADEYQAAQWGLSGLASGTSRHEVITAKMDSLGGTFEELTQVVKSPEEAIKIVAETIEALPEIPTRSSFLDLLQRVLGETEETALLIDYIQDMWESVDMLNNRFGPERAQKIIALPSSLIAEEREGAHE
jgi:hypothetical protein